MRGVSSRTFMSDRPPRPETTSATQVGDRYRVERVLGRGGMGTVVAVVDERSGQSVALKRSLDVETGGDESGNAAPLQREYHTLKQLKHPNIIEALDFGVDEQGPYYTMELLSGADLRDLAPVAWRHACLMLRDLASALSLLHSRRLLHRDVSPRNVRCDAHGVPKLLDFGALATIGVSVDVVGTPPFIPREALHGQPLDQRADIYGLGALAYWLLTGRHAYPVTTLVALEAAWRKTPEPPSVVDASIPPALDELVMSMVKPDPLARPSSAAEVCAKLEVIAQLPPLSVEVAAQAYLSNPVMTGRAAENSVLRQRLRRAIAGRGGAVLIEGAPGLGRTRLLQETMLDATLEGVLVARAHARTCSAEPYGAVQAWVKDLLESAPEDVTNAARAHRAILGHLFPAVHQRLGGGKLSALPQEPSEVRARIQHTLRTWLMEIAQRRPLLLAVDDVHRCDEPSAALIASLALDAGAHSLLILTTLRAGSEAEAGAPIRALREHSSRIALRPLTGGAMEQLMRSLFGDAPNTRRLSDWVHEMSGGNPTRAMELVHDLVARHVLVHENGLWILPTDFTNQVAPESLADAFALRIDSLSEHARHMAEILSVCAERLPLELFLRVAGGDRALSFRALDELVMAHVIVGGLATYDFAQEGFREALLRALPRARRRAIHLNLGEAFLARGVERPVRKVQAGFHLLRGGAEVRGAELLVQATLMLGETASGVLDLGPMFVGALEAALAVFERTGRPPSERITLQIALARCAYLHDRRLLHHGLSAIEQLRSDVGLVDAERADPSLPADERWRRGKAVAVARYNETPVSERGLPQPIAAPALTTAVFAVAGVMVVCLDVQALTRLRDGLRIWSALGEDHPGRAAYRMVASSLEQLRGRDASAHQLHRQRRRDQPDVEVFRSLPQEVLLHLRAASLHGIGMAEALEGRHAFSRAEELEALDSRTHAGAAMQIRMLKYLHDGDIVRAEACRERMEAFALEGGTSWQVDLLLPAYLAIAYSVSGDMLGLRRVIEQLDPIAREFPGFAPFLWLARGAYHRERGELQESKQALLKSMELGGAGEHACWSKAVASYVQTLVVGREHELARRVAGEALAQCGPLGIDPQRLRWSLTPAVATAEARVGETVLAAERLDAVIEEARAAEAAGVVLGRLHEARARVALLSADRQTFHEHLGRTAHYFAATRDPMLVAAYARLQEEGIRSGAASSQPGPVDSTPPSETNERTRDLRVVVREELAKATRPPERAQAALQIVLENMGVKSGYFFVSRHDGVILAAPLHGEEPPDGLDEAAAQLARSDPNDVAAHHSRDLWVSARGVAFRLVALDAVVGGEKRVVAVLAMPTRDAVLNPASSLLLRAVSEALVAAGDAEPFFAADPVPG